MNTAMQKIFSFLLLILFALPSALVYAQQANVIDEVIWVVGDEPILRSDVEFQRINAELNGQRIPGNPYSVIPEQLAVNKLFLNQAAIDSIEVSESDVIGQVNEQMEYFISIAGSPEKLEEYRGMSVKQIRQELIKYYIESEKIREVKKKIIGENAVTPAEVRRYFKNMPQDSLPYIMPQVEVQILSQNPEVSQAEIDRIKEELMDYAKRVNSGEASFATLARMYSQDESSARMGGEMDYSGRAQFVPEFSDVAFSLTDKNTVSKIVKTEYGYHIIQLIDRKGDKVKVRHILRRPTVSDEAITKSLSRLDSIANDIRNHKFTFNEAVMALSEDKETRNNNGLMVNKDYQRGIQTSRFEMKDLPADVAKVVNRMHVGEISDAFLMKNRNGQETCAIVLLKNRIDGHRADITADFQILSDIVQSKREESILENWIKDKQKSTYISIKEGWKKTDFRYPGWIK